MGRAKFDDEGDIPQIVHFIWMGNPVPEKYLKNIHLFTSKFREQGYEVILWTDDLGHYDKAVRKSPIYSETGIPGLEVKNISHIVERAIYDYKGKSIEGGYDKGEVFAAIVDLERVGLYNYSMVSDLLRYELLRQQGGIYLDADNRRCTVTGEMKEGEALLKGFKVHAYVAKVRGVPYFAGGSDVLASCPDHVLAGAMVDNILKLYSDDLVDKPWQDYEGKSGVDRGVLSSYGPFLTYHDIRRSPDRRYCEPEHKGYGNGGVLLPARHVLTMSMSGPDAFAVVIRKFIRTKGEEFPEQFMLQNPYDLTKKIRREHHVSDDSTLRASVAGVGVERVSAISWCCKLNYPSSFDDTAIPRSTKHKSFTVEAAVEGGIEMKMGRIEPMDGGVISGEGKEGEFVSKVAPFPLALYRDRGLLYGKDAIAKDAGCGTRFCQGARSLLQRVCGGGGSAGVTDASMSVGL